MRELVAQLRDLRDEATATDADLRALSWNESYVAALNRCAKGACKSRDFHFAVCVATGKSRPLHQGASARSRAADTVRP